MERYQTTLTGAVNISTKMSQRACVPQPTPLKREHISVQLASLEAAFLWRELCCIFWGAAQCPGSLAVPESTVPAEDTYCDLGYPGTDPHGAGCTALLPPTTLQKPSPSGWAPNPDNSF